MNDINCEFFDTDTYFNGKKVYKCSYCNLTLSLEDPSTKMLCFKKMQNAKNMIRQNHGAEPLQVDHISPEKLSDTIFDKIQQQAYQNQADMCSEDQINERLSICENCEHYQNDLCELCGCQIVREQNYMNKLANKSASCPISKWLPIIS